jgi:hypothetical protein
VSRTKLVAVLFVVTLTLAGVPAEAAPRPKPSRVVIVLLDQARPDTITRYAMTNVRRLQRRGTSFPNALLGHMAAETVISHGVLTSGLFPKHMGWSNEVHRDSAGVLGDPGDYYVTSSMSCRNFKDLVTHAGYRRLSDHLDRRFGQDSRFVSIAQKRTAVCPAGTTSSAPGSFLADPEDIIFQIRGSSSAAACDPAYASSGWREPEYANGTPPDYLGLAPCSRWSTWQGAGAYGTGAIPPANIYPLEGDRFVPGRHPVHVGGDNWSADAAIRVIENDPTWRGMMVSLGAIDKMGHMWGPEDEGVPGAAPGSNEDISHLPFAAKNADRQVGRIVRALRARGLLDETLIVITADHAAQTGRPFLGRLDGPETSGGVRCNPPSTGLRSDCNWYYGQDADEDYRDPSPAVAQLRDALTPPGGTTNLRFSYQDGHVAAWLDDTSLAKKREAAQAVLRMPGVIASYRTNFAQNDYLEFGRNRIPRSERRWFRRHAGNLVDTMAAPYGPDVVGLMRTDVTYGVMGDHGGHTRLVQNIPMVFSGPGVGSRDSRRRMRLVDVMPTILKRMGIRYDARELDGKAVRLPKPRR